MDGKKAVNDWIRSAAGRGSPPRAEPEPTISEARIQETAQVFGLTRVEAIEKLTEGGTLAPPGHAGSGTGAPPPQFSVSQKMNQFIRRLAGR